MTSNIPLPNKSIGAQNLMSSGRKCFSGWLRRKGKINILRIIRWNNLYVVVSGGCVYIYKSETSGSPYSAFTLYGCNRVLRADDIVPSEAPWAFKLIFHSDKTRYFSASSEREMKEWMSTVKSEMLYANGKSESGSFRLSPDGEEMTISAGTFSDIEAPVYDDTELPNVDDIPPDDESDDDDYLKLEEEKMLTQEQIKKIKKINSVGSATSSPVSSKPTKPVAKHNSDPGISMVQNLASELKGKINLGLDMKQRKVPEPNASSHRSPTSPASGAKPIFLPKPVCSKPKVAMKPMGLLKKLHSPVEETTDQHDSSNRLRPEGGYTTKPLVEDTGSHYEEDSTVLYWKSAYWNGGGKELANKIIKETQEEGVYLIRESEEVNQKVLVTFAEGRPHKYKINKDATTKKYFIKESDGYFETIEGMLYFYYDSSLPLVDTKLTRPYNWKEK